MATAVVLPKLGNTVETCIIVSWTKTIGDTIVEGELLCEVETDKATVEVESPASGTVLALFCQEGDEVPVMTNIAAVGQAGEDVENLRPVEESSADSTQPDLSTAQLETHVPVPQPVVDVAASPSNERCGVSPRARNLANKKLIDVAQLNGSGPGGRIIERDIQAAIAAQPQLTPLAQRMVTQGDFQAPAQGSGPNNRVMARDLMSKALLPDSVATVEDEIETIRLAGPRRIIAERMLSSLQTTAQLTLNTTADARAILAYRKRLKHSADDLGLQKITINDLLLFVVSRTLVNFPAVNGLFTGDTLTLYKQIHLAVAIDTPRGLLVPVIRDAHRLTLRHISSEARRLAQACIEGNVSPDDLQGGTFTVSNLGSLGIENFTPILNPPQVGILGVGNINLKPVEVEGVITHIPHLNLSLTINHQVVDGAPGARFLQALSHHLADLDLLLAL